MRPIARSTPDRRHRTAPDENPDMRLKSADQSMITDVSRLRSHLCTIITSIASNAVRGEDAEPRVRRLTRDIRARILLDHLVGAGEQRGRNCKSERFRSLEIDHELESGWLHDR